MSLSKEEIEKVAHLSRLSLSETEIPAFTKKLAGILEMIEAIQKVPTEGIQAMSSPLAASLEQRLRNDQVTELNEREAMLALAPLTEAGLYLVPKVLA
jgi:aspartyl-tRNA(Asn)/glutamyl-tRNA(Gln) amidotransferase subunit C